MSIIIGADIVPVESNVELFKNTRTDELLGENLCALLSESDYRIFNLEAVLTNVQSPISKNGPHLGAPTACAAGLKAIGIDLFTLANNHIMDHGAHGFASTVQALDAVSIAHVGAGENIHTAKSPFYFIRAGIKYGVYACAEHEFSIASESEPGANPFDPLESLDDVTQMKAECDYAIVLYHGGKEHYRYPSPYLQKVCRKLVEKGANLVVCQHSHCVGCKEEYAHGTIVYGQGNFLFDGQDDEYWNTGLLLNVDPSGKIEYTPIRKEGCGTRLASSKEAEEILKQFHSRSAEIMRPGCITEKYDDFAQRSSAGYILLFSGRSRSFPFRVLNKLSGKKLEEVYARFYRHRFGTEMRNYIECEAHRELILKGLGN